MSIESISDLLNTDRYPIDDLENPLRADAIAVVRKELEQDGCAVIREFFSVEGLTLLREEARERVPMAYYSENKACNAYLGDGSLDFDDEHPRNIFMARSNGFVPADTFDEDTYSHQLYYWPPLKQFMADCLGKDELHIYEDPVSNMIVNVARPGEQFNWHFDTNEFTITMLLQAAESGGHFEYVPNLRNPEDECYNEVKKVLDGDRSRVKRLTLDAGDLQIFLGRFSLHQVTENTGARTRLLLIMSFAEMPGMVGNRVRVKNLYGKTTDAHDNAGKGRVRADRLVD